MRGMRIALAVAVSCACAALVAGAFSNSVDPVAAAAMRSEDAGGANLALTASATSPGGQPVSVTATGVFDGQEADVTAEVSSALAAAGAPSGAGQVELRYLQENGDPVVYVNVPSLAASLPGGATWVRLDLEQVGKQVGVDVSQLIGEATANPADILGLLQASGQVQTVGPELIDGVPTTHYRALVELDKVAGSLGGALGQDLASRLSAPGMPTSIPVDVWIGADGLVRRASIDESLSVAGATTDLQAQVDLSGYGTPVSVTAPPADQVFDLTGLASNLLAGLGSAIH